MRSADINRHHEEFPRWPGIIFMGTPDFAVPSLKALVEYGHNVLAVVTQPDRPKGRGRKVVASPVKRVATEYHLEVLQPERASGRQFCEVVRDKGPDLLIVVAFGQILKDDLLRIPRRGPINVHASLLPKYRGAAPIQWAILKNESKTGLTAMRMDVGLDTGPIVLQEEVAIGKDETAGQLHDRLSGLSGDFLLRTIKGLEEGRLQEKPQDHGMATYAPKIERAMSWVNWDQPAQTVSALIRALDPWPGALTTLGGRELKLFSSRVVDEVQKDTVPGRAIRKMESGLEVETGRGVIEVREFQLPGKKRLVSSDFLRGVPLEEGTIFGG
jgi:methionyl-tRNA formyltransferase